MVFVGAGGGVPLGGGLVPLALVALVVLAVYILVQVLRTLFSTLGQAWRRRHPRSRG